MKQKKRGFQQQQKKNGPPQQGGQGQPGGAGQGRGPRSAKAPVVRGSAVLGGEGAAGNRKGWQAAPKDLFVYHTSCDTESDDIKDVLKETADITVINVEKRSREYSYYGSFRVTISRQDFTKALKPEYWPEGWSVREYFHARKKPEDKNNRGVGRQSEESGNGGNVSSAASSFLKQSIVLDEEPQKTTA